MIIIESDVKASEMFYAMPQERQLSMESDQNWEELNARVITYHQQGWYSEAASLGEEALVLAEEIFGSDHLNTAKSLKNLALVYFAQAQDAEAAIFKQTLPEKDEKTSLSDSQEIAQSLNRMVLLNLAKSKYSRAESHLNRSLAIKKQALGSEHPDVLETTGNLAALYNALGRDAEAKSLLRPLRSQDAIASISIGMAEAEESSKGFIEGYESRTAMRHSCHFPVRITKQDMDTAIRGVTENLSQIGAFIKTKDLSAFKVNDKAVVAFLLPRSFSKLDVVVGLEGTAKIARIDQVHGGIGLRFTKEFRHFKWV